MKKLMISILICMMFIFIGCGPNIRHNISAFDGTKSISLNNDIQSIMCTKNFFDPQIRLGLFKNSNMLEEDLYLTVTVPVIDSLGTLCINVDGKYFRFEPIDRFTDFSPYGRLSSKRYLVKVSLLKKMVFSEFTHIKVNLSRTYIVGSFENESQRGCNVRRAFTEFYKQLQETFPLSLKKEKR